MPESPLHAVPGDSSQPTDSGPLFKGGPGGQPPTTPTRSAQKQRAEKSLPTDRLRFDKQVEVLSAMAQLSGPNKKPVTAEELSTAIGLKGNTGGLSNRFFHDTEWVERTGRGEYAATDALLSYHRHLTFDPSDGAGARAYLLPAIKRSWYWADVLESMLHGAGVRMSMVLFALSKGAGATEGHKPQLEMIVSWLEWIGLVSRDGEMVYATTNGHEPPASDPIEGADGVAAEFPMWEDIADLGRNSGDDPNGTTSSAESVDSSAMISFSMSVRITADDAAKLSSEQLESLLAFAEKLRN